MSDRSAKRAGRGRDGFSTAFKQKLGETGKTVIEEMGRKQEASSSGAVKAGETKLKPTDTSSKPAAAEDRIEALETFVEDGNPEEVQALLADPDVQALLGQLAALLAAAEEAEAPAETAGGAAEALFIPLAAPDNAGTSAAAADASALQAVDAAEAARLLQELQEALRQTGDPKLKTALEQLASAAGRAAESKPGADIAQLLQKLNGEAVISEPASPKEGSMPVSALHKLGQLSAVHAAQTASTAGGNTAELADEPLFVPLDGEAAVAQTPVQPAVTVPDLMKQIQSGQYAGKMPVLQVPAETFAEDMTQFVSTSFLLNSGAGGMTEAKLSLYPQHLGHVEVKLMMQNGQLIAQFAADSALGKEMLESQLAQLRHSLQSQGIQVEKLEVTQSANAQGFQSGMFQERDQGRQPQSKQSQKAASSRIAALGEETGGEGTPVEKQERPARTGNGWIDFIA